MKPAPWLRHFPCSGWERRAARQIAVQRRPAARSYPGASIAPAARITRQEAMCFSRPCWRTWGGLSQGSVAKDRDGQAPKVELALRRDGAYAGHVLVSDGEATRRYRIRYDELVPMALFVDGGGTSLYTFWNAERLPPNFQREAGFAKYDVGQGFVAIEFAATRFADALHFLDTCGRCVAFPDDDSDASVRARRTGRFASEAGNERRGNYINADVDSTFEIEQTGAHAIKVPAPSPSSTGALMPAQAKPYRWTGSSRSSVPMSCRQTQSGGWQSSTMCAFFF